MEEQNNSRPQSQANQQFCKENQLNQNQMNYLQGYHKLYPYSYFGITTQEQFKQLTTFDTYNFQDELRNSQVILKGAPLKLNELENIITNLQLNNRCTFCNDKQRIKCLETSGTFNFVRFCCSKMVQFLMIQNITSSGKRLTIQQIKNDQNNNNLQNNQINKSQRHVSQKQQQTNHTIDQYLQIIGSQFTYEQQNVEYQYFVVTPDQKQLIEDQISDKSLIQSIQHEDVFILKVYDDNSIQNIQSIIKNSLNSLCQQYNLIIDNFPETLFKSERRIQQIIYTLYQQFEFITQIDVHFPVIDQNVKQQFDYTKLLRFEHLKPGICCFLCKVDSSNLNELEQLTGTYELQIGAFKYTDIHFCYIQ